MPDRPWKDAIVEVLRESKGAMDYKDIADRIVVRKIKKNVGATPAISVNNAIRLSIKNDATTPFEWVGRGLYRLRSTAETCLAESQVQLDLEQNENENTNTSIIHAFGMFWERDKILWKKTPEIFGKQQTGAKKVNFSEQRGVYLLYDKREVVYVGRSVDRSLGTRLYEHTQDRLCGRWDRFSWFGLLNVTEQGELQELQLNPSVDTIINTLEALLIEGLEPRQNRRRGDEFNAIEYLQEEDPQIRKRLRVEAITDLMKSVVSEE